MEFRVLGPLEARLDGRPLPIHAPKERALLAALLLHANTAVPIVQLVDALWGEAPPATARHTLRNYVLRLRGALRAGGTAAQERLITKPAGYLLVVHPGEFDLHRFERLVATGTAAAGRGAWEPAAAALRAALGLWRGPALADVGSEPLRRTHRPRLEERRLEALHQRVQADLHLGRHADLIAELEALCTAHPLDERLHAHRLLALYRCGRRADALTAYRAVRRTLVDELGIEPGLDLQRLQRSILAADPGLDAPAPAGTGLGAGPPCQLPPADDDFVGRTQTLDAVEGLLAHRGVAAPPIVAITGQAGVGKTALAVHVAHRLRSRFPDGQLYASLHGSRREPLDSAEVVAGFLRALGVDPGTMPQSLEERVALYRSRLADRRVLLVLDDAATAAQIRPLMPGTPASATLITGRTRPVGLEGCQVVTLGPLAPGEALELLAKTVGSGRVHSDPGTAATIARLCGHLPLALRIAGARLAAKPHWLLGELAERLRDERRRLAELHAGDLDVRASLDLSYQACRPAERRAFRLLSLFDGPDLSAWSAASLLDLDAAAAVDLLEELVDASLLGVAGRDPLGQLRYRFHDMVRLFGRERLLDEEPASARRAAFDRLLVACGALARWADRHLQPDQRPLPSGGGLGDRAVPVASLAAVRPLDWFDAERPNLVAAVGQAARDGYTNQAVALASALVNFLEVRQHLPDWERVTAMALEAAVRSGDRHAEASTLLLLGKLRCQQGRFDDALACHARCLSLAGELGDRRAQAQTLRTAAQIHRLQGRLSEAITCASQSRDLHRLVGDRHGDSAVLLELAEVYRLGGRHSEAVACLRRASDVFEELGDRVWTARAQLGLGNALRAQNRRREATDAFRRALAAFRDAADRRGEAHAMRGIAETLRELGRYRAAVALFQRCLEVFADLGDDAGAARVQYGLGEALRQAGETAEALIWFERCLPVFGRLGYRHWRARALNGLGAALAARGDRAKAEASWREALELFEALGMPEASDLRAWLRPGAAR